MALPIRATLEDVDQTCAYLASKPTGATLKDISGVLGHKLADARRVTALQTWGLVEAQDDGRYIVTEPGRRCTKGEAEKAEALRDTIRRIPAYLEIIERAAHRHEDSLTINDVSAHWHANFREDVGDSEESLKAQAMSFFQIAQGAGLGTMIVGRRGAETRFSFSANVLNEFVGRIRPVPEACSTGDMTSGVEYPGAAPTGDPPAPAEGVASVAETASSRRVGQGIFIAHGKNKKPLDQLKKVLEQFRIPFKVATEEPNLGRPIGGKVREVMQSCNCAILIFTADEEFRTPKGETVWRPSENVVYELGASGYLYDNRLVIMKEEAVHFPSNFRDVGYISFEKDQLEAKAMGLLKELIGFGIVKVST